MRDVYQRIYNRSDAIKLAAFVNTAGRDPPRYSRRGTLSEERCATISDIARRGLLQLAYGDIVEHGTLKAPAVITRRYHRRHCRSVS